MNSQVNQQIKLGLRNCTLRQRLTILLCLLSLGTETGLRAWFGCPKQLRNTIGRDEVVPSFIVNKKRLVPSGGSEVVMNWQCTFLYLLSFVLCVFSSPLSVVSLGLYSRKGAAYSLCFQICFGREQQSSSHVNIHKNCLGNSIKCRFLFNILGLGPQILHF